MNLQIKPVRIIPVFNVFLAIFTKVVTVSLGDKEQEILDGLLKEFERNPSHSRFDHIVRPASPDCQLMPKVFIWCPLKHFQHTILCPAHNIPLVFHCWTSNMKDGSFQQPRLVYDLHGNIILVQAIYRCKYNLPDASSVGHEYHSASNEIMQKVGVEVSKKFPIKLFYKSACSFELLDYIIVHIGRGHNFMELSEDISSINFRSFFRNHALDVDKCDFYSNVIYSFPSNDQLMHIFLAYFQSVEALYRRALEENRCSVLTCDHTFKVSKHIGVKRATDSAFIPQFKNLFVCLNEYGQVVCWRLTKTTAFEQIGDLLTVLKRKLDAREDNLKMIIVDDCCSVRGSYQNIFPNTPVKLDLFHVCQRFVKTLPKGCAKTQQLCKEFGLVFRANGDVGEERTMETPSAEDQLSNLEIFLTKWQGQLSKETLAVVGNIRKHVEKNCCSYLPPGLGTQKNERLHKLLKKSLLGGASTISPELAVAIFSVVLYIWSCKRNPTAMKHTSNSRVIPVVPVELNDMAHHSSSSTPSSTIFKSSEMTINIPATLSNNANNSKTKHFFTNLPMPPMSTLTSVIDLKTEQVLQYIISRTLHVHELFMSIEKKCQTRVFDIFHFPHMDVGGLLNNLKMVNASHTSLEMHMNEECLLRNLMSFGLELDRVPGDGNCCFSSIILGMKKVLSIAGPNNETFFEHLRSIGLGNDISSDTEVLRQLFCNEIRSNIDNYKEWVSFDITTELDRFIQSGWFDSSLGDLCVLACSNVLKAGIMVITSLPNMPYIPFIPEELLSSDMIYISYNHSNAGHYDATKGKHCIFF